MCDACLTFDRSAEVSRIDFGFVDRSVLHAPMLEDLHLRAIIHELLQCSLHRLRDIDIEADQGLAILRKEFGGSVRRVHADGELAVTI